MEDDGQTSAYDVPNVINVYFVGGMDGDHDCCGTTGYAPYPPSRDYFLMVYRGTFGTTLEHEFGHYFGLAHTHVDGLSNGDTETMLDNSDCLTTGDGICDTWPDPNFQNCRSSSCIYQEGGADCPPLTIDPASGVDQGAAVSTILQNNVMSYNSFSGCRTSFTPCQYDKLQDVLLGCRANLCDASLVRAANTTYEICVGESAPTLTAISSCYNWYSDTGDGTVALASNISSFTPTIGVGPGLLDNMTPGTYTFYLGDAIEYNPDCRTAIEVVVFGDPGDGSPGAASFSGVSTTSLSTDATVLGDFEVIGWWVTENAGVSIGDFADQTALDAALAAANAGGGTISANPVNHISPSIAGTPITMLDLTMDCGSLDDGITYFATPFISTLEPAIPDATCVETDAGSNVLVGGDLGQWAFVNPGTVSCAPTSPPNNPTYTLTVNVTAYTGAPNNLRLRVRGNGCSGGNLISQTVSGVGTYTFTEANFSAGYDPNVGGICALVYESGSGASGSGIAINISLDITYPGTSAIPFPTVNYSTCLFGSPVMLNCLVPTPVELTSFTAKKQAKTSVLNWETATEINNELFTIEHSMDGRNFTAIEEVKGAGNSQTPIAYQALDRNPQNGINYYRLKQTDFDGTSNYSNTVSLTFTDLVELKVIPNPVAKNNILVEYHASESGNLSIEIIDITGKVMSLQEFSAVAGKNNLTMDITTFNQGIYILRTQQGNDIQTMRFVRL